MSVSRGSPGEGSGLSLSLKQQALWAGSGPDLREANMLSFVLGLDWVALYFSFGGRRETGHEMALSSVLRAVLGAFCIICHGSWRLGAKFGREMTAILRKLS